MRSTSALLPVLSAIFSCGPGVATTTDATTSTSSTATTTVAPTTTGGELTTATTGVTATTGLDTSTSTATSEFTTATTEPGTTTDDTTTGEPADVEFAAFFVPGGLDRIVVRKADHDADLCTSVVFVWPMPNQDPSFMLPLEWGYQGAEVAQSAAGCLDFMGPLADAVAAETAMGWADWPVPMVCPGAADIDMAFVFAQVSPWVPAQDLLQAADIPLQGC